MEQYELLQRVVTILESMGLRYFVTGSVATIFYGEPRMTNDIDIVVDLSLGGVTEFCRRFLPPEFYVSEDAATQAVRHHGQFNIIHPESGLKIDVMVPADSPHNRCRFQRSRRIQPAPDYTASFASPEDVILKKMEYYREGGSEKHLRDIAGVLAISGLSVDREYITRWAAQMGLDDIWQEILSHLPQ